MWHKLILIGLAGAAGTLVRYWLAGWVQQFQQSNFPWATLAVNALGCLLFGLVWGMAAEREFISPEARTILLVGFLGALTTFSTYAFETAQLLRTAEHWLAVGNFAVQNTVGLVSVLLGAALARVV
jgi:CrcB protein